MAYLTGLITERRWGWAPGAPALGRLVGRRTWIEGAVLLGFIGAILTTNYALTALPNVKLLDLMVFVAGYTLGFRRGVLVASGSWLIYGTLNPWGAAGPLLLVILMASEMVYALAGSGLRRLVPPRQLRSLPGRRSLLFAAVAVVCTLTYDAVTNVYTGLTWAQIAGGSEYMRWVLVALFNPGALLFSAMHVGSNVVFFSLLGPALIKGVEKGKEALHWGQ